MWKKHFLVYIFFFGKNCIICAKTFFELFFNKKILFGKKTIICDWDYFVCVKDLLHDFFKDNNKVHTCFFGLTIGQIF